jgi:hypothetical protein
MLERFRTKKDKHSYVKKIIYELGCGYIMPDDEYYDLFVELVTKKKWEVDYFSIVPNRINTKTYECQAHLIDGEIKVFSWNKCVMDRVETDYSKVRSSMRSAIVSDILKFKKSAIMCNLCGSVELLHADHVNPFRDLANNFICENGSIVNEGWLNSWVGYHKENAVLQILCASCNYKKH